MEEMSQLLHHTIASIKQSTTSSESLARVARDIAGLISSNWDGGGGNGAPPTSRKLKKRAADERVAALLKVPAGETANQEDSRPEAR